MLQVPRFVLDRSARILTDLNHQTEAEREEREAGVCSLPRSPLEEEHGGQLIQVMLWQ